MTRIEELARKLNQEILALEVVQEYQKYENGVNTFENYAFMKRDYSQGIDLCLNEGDEVVDCDLIIICEHEIAVGRMKELG